MFTFASSVERRKGGSLGNGGNGRVTRRYPLRVTLMGANLGRGCLGEPCTLAGGVDSWQIGSCRVVSKYAFTLLVAVVHFEIIE